MNDLLLSYIRTGVPVAVGAFISWLAVKYGVVVPESLSSEATIFLTGAVIALYYGVVRALEKRWPVFGKLLGRAKEPAYAKR